MDEHAAPPTTFVRNNTQVKPLASWVAHEVEEGKRPILRAIGAGAFNQAIKAVIVARGYVATRGIDIAVRPGFVDAPGRDGTDEQISAITMEVVRL